MTASPNKVHELIERFGRNLPAYKQGRYNETLARVEFINPLFRALGWDVDNERGWPRNLCRTSRRCCNARSTQPTARSTSWCTPCMS